MNVQLYVTCPLTWITDMLLKDTFSCSPIDMKFAPHEICPISIPEPTDRTDSTVKVVWAELRKS